MHDKERKKLVFDYLDIPESERPNWRTFLRGAHLKKTSLDRYKGVYAIERAAEKQQTIDTQKREYLLAHPSVEKVEPREWIRSNKMVWLEAILKSAKGGNAQSQKLLAQMGEYLVEKQETTHKLDGSIVAAAILRADREGDYRVEEMPKELPLLPPELRSDTG